MRRVIFIIVALFVSGNLFAGAWSMEKNKLYTRLGFNYYYSDKEFLSGGGSEDYKFDGDFQDYNMSLYAEYGITDKLTAITSLYYKDIKKEDDYTKMDNNGIGDIDLGVKYNIFKGEKGVFSLQGVLKIPEAYDKDDTLALGNGQYDFELRALFGTSLWPIIPGYANFEMGYRWRAEAPADELRYLIEIGGDFTKKLYGRVKLDGILGMGNGDKEFDFSGNPTLSSEYDLGKLDITIGYKVYKNIAVEFEYTPEIYGKDTSLGATYTFAISAIW